MKKNIVVGSSIAMLLLIAFFAWWKWSENQEIAQAKEIAKAAFENRDKMSRDERDAAFQQMREVRDNLNESQRKKLGEDMRSAMMQRMQERMDQYFEKPPRERIAFLDEEIKRDEERRRAREKNARPAGKLATAMRKAVAGEADRRELAEAAGVVETTNSEWIVVAECSMAPRRSFGLRWLSIVKT